MSAVLNAPPAEPGKRLSLALTVAVHLLLAIFLIYGIRWQTQAPEAVEVELVRSIPAAPPRVEPLPPPPEVKPAPPPPEPKIAVKPPPKPEIAIKEKVKPLKEPPKPRPDAVLQEQLRLDQERLNQIKQSNAASAEVAQLRAAQTDLKRAQEAAAGKKALDDYVAKIRGKIRGNIVVPPEIKGHPEAVFEVDQLPSGEVLTVRMSKSSGNDLLDIAIERAIWKSSPLPKPDQADAFRRSLALKVRPLDD